MTANRRGADGRRSHRGRRTPTVALAATVLVAGLVVGGSRGSGAERSAGPAAGPGSIALLPLSTSTDRRIVDARGREVLLRGANVNSLGEYWQGSASEPPTIALSGADWDAMAARGFSVVRLLITWSRVEPRRDEIDHAYLDQVDAAVREAADHGIYVVLDMHQDAYSAFISTTDPASCPAGTYPAKGWDGAPAWAVITDGLSTCTPGERNASPAVRAAWNHFYDNTDGIRDELVEAWGAVASRFAGRPEVAGYDLLNEPEVPRPAAEIAPLYEAFLADTIDAIRAAEAAAPFDHLVFIEPGLPAGNPAYGLVIPDPVAAGVDTRNIVASVHNYAESIGALGLTIEAMNDLIEALTASMGVPNWGGEYGFWDVQPTTLAKVARYAADEDDHRWGGAWWQWRQSCGDPHHVQWQGGQVVVPAGDSIHLNRLTCPGNVPGGETDEFLDVLGRAYPRATPGRLTSLTSDPATGRLDVVATASPADVGEQLLVWAPSVADDDHRVTTQGLVDVGEQVVPGGRLITATVAAAGTYGLRIGGIAYPPGSSTTTSTSTSTSTPTSTMPGSTSVVGSTQPGSTSVVPTTTSEPPSTSGPSVTSAPTVTTTPTSSAPTDQPPTSDDPGATAGGGAGGAPPAVPVPAAASYTG